MVFGGLGIGNHEGFVKASLRPKSEGKKRDLYILVTVITIAIL